MFSSRTKYPKNDSLIRLYLQSSFANYSVARVLLISCAFGPVFLVAESWRKYTVPEIEACTLPCTLECGGNAGETDEKLVFFHVVPQVLCPRRVAESHVSLQQGSPIWHPGFCINESQSQIYKTNPNHQIPIPDPRFSKQIPIPDPSFLKQIPIPDPRFSKQIPIPDFRNNS